MARKWLIPIAPIPRNPIFNFGIVRRFYMEIPNCRNANRQKSLPVPCTLANQLPKFTCKPIFRASEEFINQYELSNDWLEATSIQLKGDHVRSTRPF